MCRKTGVGTGNFLELASKVTPRGMDELVRSYRANKVPP